MALVKINPTLARFPKNNFFTDSIWNEDFFKPFFNDAVFEKNTPAVNVAERKDAFVLEIAAPGLDKADFKVSLEKDLLTVSVKRETENDQPQEEVTYRRREFTYNHFERTFKLPKSVDSGKIGAKYENGILFLDLPKKEQEIEQPPREIEIG